MEIIKSKRRSKCCFCRKIINQKYKVVVITNSNLKPTDYSHLSCYYRNLKSRLEHTKKQLKEFSKQKYRKQMIIESLEK